MCTKQRFQSENGGWCCTVMLVTSLVIFRYFENGGNEKLEQRLFTCVRLTQATWQQQTTYRGWRFLFIKPDKEMSTETWEDITEELPLCIHCSGCVCAHVEVCCWKVSQRTEAFLEINTLNMLLKDIRPKNATMNWLYLLGAGTRTSQVKSIQMI